FRFGFRSSERRTLAVGLREEGWHFVYATGDYEPDAGTSVAQFQKRVDEIHRRTAQVGALESEPAQKQASTRRRQAAKADQPTNPGSF
ncbi:MAG: hypothetical protein JWM29_1009, partial [Solirubrobacterales bacterium]|nr:hypothetical protein [Solirubrobacterales bacterium]